MKLKLSRETTEPNGEKHQRICRWKRRTKSTKTLETRNAFRRKGIINFTRGRFRKTDTKGNALFIRPPENYTNDACMLVSTFAQTYLETARRDRYERASKLRVYHTERLEIDATRTALFDPNNRWNNNLYNSPADKYFPIILGWAARVIRRQTRLCL